jgi:Zn-dependent protease with chaperone function
LTRRDLLAAQVRGLSALFAGLVAGILLARATGGNIANLPIWLAAYVVATMAALAPLSLLNRRRESRADQDAVALCGDPAALVRGLAEVRATTERVRRLLFGSPPLAWILWPVSWQLPTHPPMDERVARLAVLPR